MLSRALALLTNPFDAGIMELLAQWRNPVLDWFFYITTRLGDTAMIWILLGAALLSYGITRQIKRLTKTAMTVLTSLLASYLMTEVVLKPVIDRPRPLAIDPLINHLHIETLSSSFPSGHTGWGFAVIPALWALDRRAGIAATVFAFFMGLSRMYLGVHWTTDVIGGAVVGFCCGFLVNRGLTKLDWF